MAQAVRNTGDRLLSLARHPVAGPLMKALGLPRPPPLFRGGGTTLRADALLRGQSVRVFRPVPEGELLSGRSRSLVKEVLHAASADVGGSSGTPASRVVVDLAGVRSVAQLRDSLYVVAQDASRAVRDGGRLVFVNQAVDEDSLTGAERLEALRDAAVLDGVVRGLSKSLARELASRGTTVNQLTVAPTGGLSLDAPLDAAHPAHEAIATPLGFFLAPDSAFITAQRLRVRVPAAAPSGPGASSEVAWHTTVGLPLAGRVALVTGAARGIGAAIVQRLTSEGASVVGLDVAPLASDLQATMQSVGGLAVVGDVTDSTAPSAAMQAIRAWQAKGGSGNGGGSGGLVDLVVHNAGVTRDRTLRNMKVEEMDAVLRINLEAVLRWDQALGVTPSGADAATAPLLRERGRVVYLSSIVGFGGGVGQTVYAGTKAGLQDYVRFLAPIAAQRGVTGASGPFDHSLPPVELSVPSSLFFLLFLSFFFFFLPSS